MADGHKNFAYSTVATAPSPATTGVSIVLSAGGGALMPAVPFNAVVWPAGVQPLASNAEIVRVTAISTDTLTITRIQEGTSARTIGVGDQVAAAITARTLSDNEMPLAPTEGLYVRPGTGAYIPMRYEILSTTTTEIGLGAILEIG
jgi:hypothetical protein